jgi:hypothetical protein
MEPNDFPRVMVAVAGALLSAALLWHWARIRLNIRIFVNGDRVSVGGAVLTGRRGLVIDFFKQDLPGVRRAWVLASWDNRRVKFHWTSLPRWQRQRLRNFLLTIL